MIVYVGSGEVGYQRLSDGQTRTLVANSPTNVWAWVGHISCAGGPDGWVLNSPNSYHNYLIVGNDQTASFDMSLTNATTGKIWAHQHNFSTQYEKQPQSVLSPSGTRALFASDWKTSTYYPFVAQP